jgi:hypothetical protein
MVLENGKWCWENGAKKANPKRHTCNPVLSRFSLKNMTNIAFFMAL